MGIYSPIYTFTKGSTKRHSLFIDMQKTSNALQNKTVTMLGMSVNGSFSAIVATLEKIVEMDNDSRIKSEANGLLRKESILGPFDIHKK